jgi:hypothetical protein
MVTGSAVGPYPGLGFRTYAKFQRETPGFIREPTRTIIKKSGIVENVAQNWITGRRFKIFVDEIKGIRSLRTEKILVFIKMMQRNIVIKSGWEDRLGRDHSRAQVEISVPRPESSAPMFSQFLFVLFVVLSILAKLLGD